MAWKNPGFGKVHCKAHRDPRSPTYGDKRLCIVWLGETQGAGEEGRQERGDLQLVGAAVVEFELCADEHLACLLGFQLQLQPKPVWRREEEEMGVTPAVGDAALLFPRG